MAPQPKLDIKVEKPNPCTNPPNPDTFDLGLLLATDPNPLPPSTDNTPQEQRLATGAREAAQVLIGQLLTTCKIESTSASVLLTLPASTTALPREKPVPAPKEKTKWEKFAERKGIRPKTREQRRAKASQFNEETGEWEKSWGYKGKRKEGEVQRDWLVELPDRPLQRGQGDEQGLVKEQRMKALGKSVKPSVKRRKTK